LTFRRACWTALLGLGAVAGAVLPDGASAQVPVRRDTSGVRRDTANTRVDTAGGRRNLPPAGRDTVRVPLPPRADTLMQKDSTGRALVPLPALPKADTIKAPLARGEAPAILEIGAARVYDRTALFATGASSLIELLGRVPGLTEFATGYLGAPAAIASEGDLRRVRVFLDGLEMDPMDVRSRGTSAAGDLPLHALEEVRIERGAEEVRVYARSWRVDRTIPFTRADIMTGDQNSNLYRAWFGRRYDHGEAIQVAAEQYTSQPTSRLPSSDALNVMLRLGMTHGPWSADALLQRSHRNRADWAGAGSTNETRDTVPAIETNRSTSYLRLGNGDPEQGRWLQLIASSHSFLAKQRSSTSFSSAVDTTSGIGDSTSYENQYLLTGGVSRRLFSVSAAERMRAGNGRVSHVLSARGSATLGPLALSVYNEGKSYLNPSRAEATGRVALTSRLALLASASRTGSGDFDRLFVEQRNGSVYTESGAFTLDGFGQFVTPDTSEATRYRLAPRTNARAEIGVRLRDLWLSGGIMRRGKTTLLAPAVFGTQYEGSAAVRREGDVSARTLAMRGRMWRAVNVDAWAVAWNDSGGVYRPRYQTRGELYLQTNLLDRFPNGNFGLLTSLSHEYRSNSFFATSGDSVRVAPGYRMVSFKLEIRIQTAVVSYQFRNLLQEKYQQVPGFPYPRQSQFYGVRWEFWN
jgi:hypothetical protein